MAEVLAKGAMKGYAVSQVAQAIDGVFPGVGSSLAAMGALVGLIQAAKQGNNQEIIAALIEKALVC